MRSLHQLVLLSLALALPAPVALAGNVFVVDAAGGPGADFTDLQAAVDAAFDSDVILLRSGAYATSGPFGNPSGPISVFGKGLSIVELPGEQATVAGLNVDFLSPDQTFVLRGVDVAPGGRVDVEQCGGAVWIEDLSVTGPALVIGSVILRSNAEVHLTRIQVACAQTLGDKPGIEIWDSSVALYDSVAQGCVGPAMSDAEPDAVEIFGSTLFVAGSTLVGGPDCAGNGLFAFFDSTVTALDTTFIAGAATGCSSPPSPVIAANLNELAGTARSLRLAPTASAGGTLGGGIQALPGDVLWLSVSTVPGSATLPFAIGQLELSPTSLLATLPVGTAGPDGMLSLAFPVGALPSAVTLFAQAAALDPVAFDVTLSSPSVTTLIP